MHSRKMKPIRKQNKTIKNTPPTSFSSTQVLHSEKQVTDFDEIEYGKKYKVHGLSSNEDVVFVSHFIDNNQVTWLLDQNSFRRSLADMGVIPYENGNWNSVGWIEILD